MTKSSLSYAPEEVSPPGETLRDLMEERSLSQAELSRLPDVERRKDLDVAEGTLQAEHALSPAPHAHP